MDGDTEWTRLGPEIWWAISFVFGVLIAHERMRLSSEPLPLQRLLLLMPVIGVALGESNSVMGFGFFFLSMIGAYKFGSICFEMVWPTGFGRWIERSMSRKTDA